MSSTATRWAWDVAEKSDISSKAVTVLTALAHFHNQETGRCNPGKARLMKRTKYSRTAIKDALRELREAGLLKIVRRQDHGATSVKNCPNSYVFLMGGGASRDPGVGRHATPKESVKGPAVPSAFYDLANLLDTEGE